MAHHRIPLYCVSDSCKDRGIEKNAEVAYPPLALGMLIAVTRKFPDVWDQYEVVPTVIASDQELRSSFRTYGPGVYLFSDYIWAIKMNLHLSRLAKELSSLSITVHGGPSMPKDTDGFQALVKAHSHIDVGVRGEGEHTAVELLRTIALTWPTFDPAALSGVAGIMFRERSGLRRIVRTKEREREKNLDVFPSPYLTNVFDLFEDRPETWVAAIVETNRGCPYGCTFCDWGSATLQKIYQFSMERVSQEIEWVAKQKVPILWIADANFGIFDRDVAIAEKICETKSKYGYPRDVIVNYAKNATSRLADIIRLFKEAGLAAVGIISIQTHDPQTLSNVNRANIRTDRYEELIEIFRNQGLPVSSDLLIGLPGTTIASFKADLQFFIDRQVHTVAYPLMVLPNSPMGERSYMEKFGIKLDPNGYVLSTNSFSGLDLWHMKMMFGLYRGTMDYSILRYLLYYLQLSHGIKAMDFIYALTQQLLRSGSEWPVSFRVLMRDSLGDDGAALLTMRASDWESLYAEILAFTDKRFGVRRSTAIAAIVSAQVALMPRLGRVMPDKVSLRHDIVAYFDQFRWLRNIGSVDPSTLRPLEDFDPVELEITDPHGLCGGGWSPSVDLHRPPRWELSSALSAASGTMQRPFVQQANDIPGFLGQSYPT
jgi:radical SAM superfamily enzyme YgiQ (UPF0313 family)